MEVDELEEEEEEGPLLGASVTAPTAPVPAVVVGPGALESIAEAPTPGMDEADGDMRLPSLTLSSASSVGRLSTDSVDLRGPALLRGVAPTALPSSAADGKDTFSAGSYPEVGVGGVDNKPSPYSGLS
jgi:hypothetical protein